MTSAPSGRRCTPLRNPSLPGHLLLAKQFTGRPFGADLSDNKRKNLLDSIRLNQATMRKSARNVGASCVRLKSSTTAVCTDSSMLQGPLYKPYSFKTTIRPIDAWYAMEELWIKRGFAKKIQELNSDVEKDLSASTGDKKTLSGEQQWQLATVKKVEAISIGAVGLDADSAVKTPPINSKTMTRKLKRLVRPKRRSPTLQPQQTRAILALCDDDALLATHP